MNILTFADDGILRNLAMMLFGGIFFMIICLLKDFMLFDWFIYKFLKISRKLPTLSQEIDSDVKEEKDKIRNMTSNDVNEGNLVLNGLSKFYGNHLAVNQLHLSIGDSECFGLLGVNGAGKTTVYNIIDIIYCFF